MHFFIQSLSLMPSQTSDCIGLQIRYNSGVGLAPNATIGSFKTRTFEAKLLQCYVGFEVFPDEQGVTIAVLDSDSIPYTFDGTAWQRWQDGAFNTPAQVRAGISLWSGPIRFLFKLERLDDGSSPLVSELRFGYEIAGNWLLYAVEFGLARLFSVPFTLTRWLDTPDQAIADVNPSRVVATQTFPLHGRYMANIGYTVPLTLIPGNQPYQIEETPCILVQVLDTANHRTLTQSTSVRISDDGAQILAYSRIYDQPLEMIILAQTTADVREIADTMISAIDRGRLPAPAYGIDISMGLTGTLRMDGADTDVIEGQLNSATFTVNLLNLPMGERSFSSGLLQGIDMPDMVPID